MKYSYQNLINLNPAAKTFLDLGCGQGFVSLYACARGLQVDAVDIEKVTPLAIQDLKTVNYISADLNSWQPADKYDIIVAHHSLQFLSKKYALNEFIPKLCASLNQGGLLEIFSFTPEEELNVPTKYTLEEILAALNFDLEVIKQEVLSYEGLHKKLGKHTFHELHVIARKKVYFKKI